MTSLIVFGGGGCRASTGRVDQAMTGFVQATRDNRRNVYPLHALHARRKVFPHDAMYRGVLRDALHGPGWEALQAASPVWVLLAYVRRGAPFARSVLGALHGYRRRSKGHILHGEDARLPSGMGTETVTLQTAASRKHAVDTIMTSSATWPITPLPLRQGRRCQGPLRLLGAITKADDIARLLHGAQRPPRPSPPGRGGNFPDTGG